MVTQTPGTLLRVHDDGALEIVRHAVRVVVCEHYKRDNGGVTPSHSEAALLMPDLEVVDVPVVVDGNENNCGDINNRQNSVRCVFIPQHMAVEVQDVVASMLSQR
eukprot:PhM_4_TR13484/c0_g1_i1/m.17696